MKKLLFVIAFATVLPGCKKKFCWECTTVTSGGGTGTSKSTYCDETEESIKNRIGTTTATDTVGGKLIQLVYETTCQKQ